MKNLVKRRLKKHGLVVKAYNSYDEQIEQVRYEWIKKLGISTVIDIGGGIGEFAAKARRVLPNAKILTFEALPESFAKIQQRFAKDVNHIAFNTVLNDEEQTAEFFISSYPGSSSLFEMSELHKEAYPYSRDLTGIQVETRLLDSMLIDIHLEKEIWLKLDVQGAELRVLKGAQNLLANAALVHMEVCFRTLYTSQPLFDDLVLFMNGKGFRVVGIENVLQDIRDGSFLHGDLFFARLEYFSPRNIKQ